MKYLKVIVCNKCNIDTFIGGEKSETNSEIIVECPKCGGFLCLKFKGVKINPRAEMLQQTINDEYLQNFVLGIINDNRKTAF